MSTALLIVGGVFAYILIGVILSFSVGYFAGVSSFGESRRERKFTYNLVSALWPVVAIIVPIYLAYKGLDSLSDRIIEYLQELPLKQDFKAMYDKNGNIIQYKYEQFVNKYGKRSFEEAKERYFRLVS